VTTTATTSVPVTTTATTVPATTTAIVSHTDSKKTNLYESESFVNKYLIYYLSGTYTLQNGYATFVCGVFKDVDDSDEEYGHFFIIYKQNDVIYYYDQSNGIHSKNINIIAKHRGQKLIGCWVYDHLTWDRKCILKKDKLAEEIPIG
jgi:hypothetical protein